MNKRGYLLSELIISFALSFIILITIFNTTITLNQKLSDLYVENKAISQQIIFNRKIGNDFASKTVTDMDGSDPGTCKITYSDGVKTLEFSNKSGSNKAYIEYDDEKINIPDNMKIGDDKITCEIINGIAKLKVPITYSRKDKDYGIELYNLSSSFTY